MEVDFIFKVAGFGMIVAVLYWMFKTQNRDDLATVVSVVGMVTVLYITIQYIARFFEAVRTMFQL